TIPIVAVAHMAPSLRPLLLRLWRDVPFPGWMRHVFLRILNPSFMVGAMALIQDEQGRILILEHTYRRQVPWGLPGGWLKHAGRRQTSFQSCCPINRPCCARRAFFSSSCVGSQ